MITSELATNPVLHRVKYDSRGPMTSPPTELFVGEIPVSESSRRLDEILFVLNQLLDREPATTDQSTKGKQRTDLPIAG